MGSFSIVVDTTCDLPQEYIDKYDIKILPMPYDLDGKTHEMGYWQNISPKEFYDALRNGSIASTSQINPLAYITALTEYAQQGKDAIFMTLSSGLSATYRNALLALEEVKESYPDANIYVLDSLNATNGLGLLTILAAEKRAEGLSIDETAAWIEERKHYLHGFLTVDDLMYLHRGGRLSKLSAVAGAVLNIKPVINFAPDGTLCLKDKVRGREAALDMITKQMNRCILPDTALDTVIICHSDCEEYANTFAEMVKSAMNVKQVLVMVMGPIIGAHLGPGSVTVILDGDMTRGEFEKKYY